jgi:hypothetical protein
MKQCRGWSAFADHDGWCSSRRRLADQFAVANQSEGSHANNAALLATPYRR